MNPQARAPRHWRAVTLLSAPLLILFLVFMLLVAFGRGVMALNLAPGVTLGLLLASLLIVGTWLTTWLYVLWANRHLDRQAREPRPSEPA